MRKWYQDRRGGYFFLLLGIGLMLVFGALEWRFPASHRLEAVTGRVTWSYTSMGALYYTVAGDARQFALLEKGDRDGRMRAAVRDATMLYPVTIKFDPRQTTRPGFLPGFFYTTFGVAVGGKDVTTFDDVRAAHRRDNLIALVLGLVFTAFGARRLYVLRGAAAPAPVPPRRRRR
ncbi:hypothetical protein NHH73_19680 [Oxalobacteraceae bacterium OTU3CINTB1]|nr:hypothetical protein NHH73_19680 [Oxalobacteraceae bacterium OTU3CINTB1]